MTQVLLSVTRVVIRLKADSTSKKVLYFSEPPKPYHLYLVLKDDLFCPHPIEPDADVLAAEYKNVKISVETFEVQRANISKYEAAKGIIGRHADNVVHQFQGIEGEETPINRYTWHPVGKAKQNHLMDTVGGFVQGRSYYVLFEEPIKEDAKAPIQLD
jgi:hypothetical protein